MPGFKLAMGGRGSRRQGSGTPMEEGAVEEGAEVEGSWVMFIGAIVCWGGRGQFTQGRGEKDIRAPSPPPWLHTNTGSLSFDYGLTRTVEDRL